MARRFLGRVIFLRHGQSEYTDIYPDITSEGVKTITESANSIKSLLGNNSSVVMITSPMARARASMDIIAKTTGYLGIIKEAPSIQGAIIRDKPKVETIFNEYIMKGGMRALCIGYSSDIRFEDPNIIEPRSEILKRFFEYFARIIKFLLREKQLPLDFICVSHYETLYFFVERLFDLKYTKDEPLDHGEIITISVFGLEIESENVVEIEVTFRERTLNKIFFDYQEQQMR